MRNKNEQQIKREFKTRQTRQIIAMTIALFLVLLGAVLYRRPDLLGPISRGTLFGMQAISIAAFLGYTAVNWRCPACGRHLGGDINRTRCRNCRAKLQ